MGHFPTPLFAIAVGPVDVGTGCHHRLKWYLHLTKPVPKMAKVIQFKTWKYPFNVRDTVNLVLALSGTYDLGQRVSKQEANYDLIPKGQH